MYNIAIVGASGLVGNSLISQINKYNITANYMLFGHKSVGTHMTVCHNKLTILDIDSIVDYQLDYALFVSSASVASTYIPQLTSQGCVCIDNSSNYRLDSKVPLVAPHVNASQIYQHNGIISNPNCTTIQLVTVLHALAPLGLKRIVCSTYQAVSGAGRDALDDLNNCAQYGSLRTLAHPISDNLIPHIDDFGDDGITLEEHKVINESRKILNIPNLPISCMAVRVPISCGHSISVNVELDSTTTEQQIRHMLSQHSSIVLYDNVAKLIYPMPAIARNTTNIYVGRIHKDCTNNNAYNLFIVADNLLRGASYNALEILLLLMEHDSDI